MKKLLNKLLPVNHPQHCILGFVEVLIGLILIINDYYFFYPPQLVIVLNDDLVGGAAVIFGIATIKWALDNKNKIAINRNLLLFSAFFWGFEITAEIMQGLRSCSPTRFVIAVLSLGLLLFTFSIIGKSPKSKYSKKQ